MSRPIAWVLHSGRFGGMERYVALTLSKLDRARYEPILVLPSLVWADEPLRAPLLAEVGDSVRVVTPSGGRGRGVGEIREVRRLLGEHRAELVHVHSADPARPIWATLAARSAGMPLVRTDHLPPLGSEARVGRLVRRMLDGAYRMMLVPSEGNRAEHVDRLGRPATKMRALHNGIALGPYARLGDPSPARRRLGWDDVTTSGTVARLDDQKGLDVVVRALAQVHESGVRLRHAFVGDGPLRGELEALVDDLGLRSAVRFVGHQDDPLPFLEAFDIAVLPSRYEGFSLSMMEYMAAGRACVFSDHPSFLEAVGDDDCAVIVPVDDVVGLAEALRSVAIDGERRHALGTAARGRAVAEFSIETHADRLMRIYDELLAKPHPAGFAR